MAEAGADTYTRLIKKYIDAGVVGLDDAIFVQFAGGYDEQVCASLGLSNCTFGNIAPGSTSTGETSASRFDAHRMPQDNASYDHVFAHAGLHHCSRPHEALHEMYRMARKSVLFVENQDSPMMRAAGRAGVVSWFELPAVVHSGYVSGGVDGTAVPNYVYRWTRREVRKAVAAFDPGHHVPIEFYSEWNIGLGRVSTGTLLRKLRLSEDQATQLLNTGHKLLNGLASSQGNIFAAMIRKDLARLQPWMRTNSAMVQSS